MNQMSSNPRATRVFALASLSVLLSLAACGGGPRPVEVTEPWTSGDERALGIEEPRAAEAEQGGPVAIDAAPIPE